MALCALQFQAVALSLECWLVRDAEYRQLATMLAAGTYRVKDLHLEDAATCETIMDGKIRNALDPIH